MRCAPWLPALLLLLVAGCGEPTGSVRGEVRFEGAPVDYGTVAAISERDGVVRQTMIVDGAYRLDEVPLGAARFTVAAHAPPRSVRPPTGDAGGPPSPQTFAIPPIPDRYRHAGHSGLAVEVVAGEQTYDLHLTR